MPFNIINLMKSNRDLTRFCKQKTVKKEIEWLTSLMTIHNCLEW